MSAKNVRVIKLLRQLHLEKLAKNQDQTRPNEVDDKVIDILMAPNAPTSTQTHGILSMVVRYHPVFMDDSYWALVFETLLIQQYDGTANPLRVFESALNTPSERDHWELHSVYPAALTGMLRAREWCAHHDDGSANPYTLEFYTEFPAIFGRMIRRLVDSSYLCNESNKVLGQFSEAFDDFMGAPQTHKASDFAPFFSELASVEQNRLIANHKMVDKIAGRLLNKIPLANSLVMLAEGHQKNLAKFREGLRREELHGV